MPVAPQILPFSFGKEPANSGDLVSVTCSAIKGDLPLEISWDFNGTPIENHQETDMVVASTNRKNSVLSIESVAARHAGRYTCMASNVAGAATHSTILSVNGTSLRLIFSYVSLYKSFLLHLLHLSLILSFCALPNFLVLLFSPIT